MGGTDDPSNLIELTVEEHALAHKKLYEQYGKKEDYLAWKGLEGEIGKEEIMYEIRKENFRKANKVHIEKLKNDPEYEKKWRNAFQKSYEEHIEKNGQWGLWNVGKKRTNEAKQNYKKAALSRKRISCKYCGNGYTKPNLAKHEKACKNKMVG